MRITQSMMARQYTNRAMNAIGGLNYVNKQVGTGRRFFRAHENPAGAATAYRLRRQQEQNLDHQANVMEMKSNLATRESSMMQVNKSLEDAFVHLLGIMNGPRNQTDVKAIVAQQFRAIQQTVVKDMNGKYGDRFLFGGSSVSEVPFELKGEKLYYRGIDVSGETEYTFPAGVTPPYPYEQTVPAKGMGKPDVMDLLNDLSKDTVYTDLGFGISFENDEVISSSAFDGATPGINVLGYGGTRDFPDNIVLLLGKIASILEEDKDVSALDPYLAPFKAQKQRVLNSVTKLGSDSMFLDYTQTRLENLEDNIKKKLSDTEHIESEEAIMRLNTMDYMYQAMLKTSNKILSNSFIDFMR